MEDVYKLGEFPLTVAAGGKALAGDIDGDGMMEVVFVRGDAGLDYRYVPHQVVSAGAYRLDGTLLWRIGDDGAPAGEFDADFPAQLVDIDGDGRLEFVCVMQKRLCVYDGETGRQKRSFPLPADDAHDCIVCCDLTGRGFLGDILLKNRYERLWALSLAADGTLKVLWEHAGNIGHYPLAVDINGDGYDEVMAGYDLLVVMQGFGRARRLSVGGRRVCRRTLGAVRRRERHLPVRRRRHRAVAVHGFGGVAARGAGALCCGHGFHADFRLG